MRRRVCGTLLACVALLAGAPAAADAAKGSKGLEAREVGGPETTQLLGPLNKRAVFVTTRDGKRQTGDRPPGPRAVVPGTPTLRVTGARGRGSEPVRVFRREGAQIFGEYDPYDPYTPVGSEPFVFLANDGVHGIEWWSTDGTPEGTRILVDGMPGAESGVDRYDTPVELDGGVTIIPVQDPEHGREWWSTDGTPEGTKLIEDVNPGPAWSNGSFLSVERVAVGRYMYWPAPDAGNREFRQLWRSDGTEEGTFPLGLRLGWGRFEGGNFEGNIIFGESQGHLYPELWSSDGTPAGTRPYHSFEDTPYSTGQYGMTTAEDRMYLSRRNVLYVVDGLDSPPRKLLDNGGALYLGPDFGTPVGRGLIFDVLTGVPPDLRTTTWVTAGTPETTRPLASVLPPSADPSSLQPTGTRGLFASRKGTTIFSTQGTKRSLRRISVAAGRRLAAFDSPMEAGPNAYFIAESGEKREYGLWRISR